MSDLDFLVVIGQLGNDKKKSRYHGYLLFLWDVLDSNQ